MNIFLRSLEKLRCISRATKSCRNSSPFFVWIIFWKSWKYCSESLFVVLFIAEQSCRFLDLQELNYQVDQFSKNSPIVSVSGPCLSKSNEHVCVSKYGNPCALSLCQSSFSSPSRKERKPLRMKDCLLGSNKGSLIRHCCPFSVGHESSRPNRTMHQRAYTRLS